MHRHAHANVLSRAKKCTVNIVGTPETMLKTLFNYTFVVIVKT